MMTQEQEEQQQLVFTLAAHDYRKKLISHALFKVSDQELSEDLVQETFMKAWSYVVKGGKIEIMRAFLYHVLNDLIVDEYRKNKTTSLDVLLESGFEPKPKQSESLFDVLDEKAALLLIQRLPKTYQNVMTLRYVQDLSIKEISAITGQTKNTITVQASRGLDKLKLLHIPV